MSDYIVTRDTLEYTSETTAWLYGRISTLQDLWEENALTFSQDGDLVSAIARWEKVEQVVDGMATFLAVIMGQIDADLNIFCRERHSFLFSHDPNFDAVLSAGLVHPHEDARRCARVLRYAKQLYTHLQGAALNGEFFAPSGPRATKQDYIDAGDLPQHAEKFIRENEALHVSPEVLRPDAHLIVPRPAKNPSLSRKASHLLPLPILPLESRRLSQWRVGRIRLLYTASVALVGVFGFVGLILGGREAVSEHLLDIFLWLKSR